MTDKIKNLYIQKTGESHSKEFWKGFNQYSDTIKKAGHLHEFLEQELGIPPTAFSFEVEEKMRVNGIELRDHYYDFELRDIKNKIRVKDDFLQGYFRAYEFIRQENHWHQLTLVRHIQNLKIEEVDEAEFKKFAERLATSADLLSRARMLKKIEEDKERHRVSRLLLLLWIWLILRESENPHDFFFTNWTRLQNNQFGIDRRAFDTLKIAAAAQHWGRPAVQEVWPETNTFFEDSDKFIKQKEESEVEKQEATPKEEQSKNQRNPKL